MTVVRISGAIFIALIVYMVAAPIAIESIAASTGPNGVLVSVLGLGWYFALWAALVASMVFIIVWTAGAMGREQEQAAVAETAIRPAQVSPAEPNGQLAALAKAS